MNRKLLNGFECFQYDGKAAATVLDFWKWMGSDLNDNLLRAALGEFLVSSALGKHDMDCARSGWRVYDLRTDYGCKVEVKTAAYRQSWRQKRPSLISFDIARKMDWENEKVDVKRHADVYVFCVFNNEDEEASPLDLSLWDFYVVKTADLNAQFGEQKSVTLPSLKRNISVISVGYEALACTISEAYFRQEDVASL